jgi:hypothetical protein
MSEILGNNALDDSAVFTKTEVGNDEVLRRTLGLPNDLRSLLLLIDGRRTLSMLRQVSVALRSSSAPIIFLEDNGFITRAGTGTGRPPSAPLAPARPAYQAPEPQRMEPPAASPYLTTQAQYSQALNQLSDIKGNMIQFVSSALGADGAHAVGRIQSAESLADLQQIARKIYDVLKAYSGVKIAEKFMQQFEGQLNLR